jgi:hypothetical protein
MSPVTVSPVAQASSVPKRRGATTTPKRAILAGSRPAAQDGPTTGTRSRRLPCASDERSRNFFGENFEAGVVARAERGHDRNVGSVAPACHQDSADARLTVTGIKCVPAASEIGLEPCAEIYGRWIARHTPMSPK